MSRSELPNAKSLGKGNSAITLYRAEMRAAKNTAEVGGRVIGSEWEQCPYEILYGAAGMLVGRIGVPLPTYMSIEDLRLGLPYEHAEALRWSYLAEAHAGFGLRIETRVQEVRIKRSYEAEIGDCVPYACAHWDALRAAAIAGPAAKFALGEQVQVAA